MSISKEILDELLQGVERPEDLLGDAGLTKELKIKLMPRSPDGNAKKTIMPKIFAR